MTVAPSGLATQPIGDAAPVTEGIWQLELPVPFPLRFLDGRIGELMFHHEERLETMQHLGEQRREWPGVDDRSVRAARM